MPTLPPEKSNSQSTGKNNSYKLKDPMRADSISTALLLREGFVHFDKNSYEKSGRIVKFDGVFWNIEGHKLLFMNELQDYLSTGKIPEE